MTPGRGPNRSQAGAKAQAEARRRIAETMGKAEDALGRFLAAGEEAAELRRLADEADTRRAAALAELAQVVGRTNAAAMAEVSEAEVRAASARQTPARKVSADTTSEPEGATSPELQAAS